MKAFAACYSGFREFLFLDADNACIADPTPLFDHPRYQDAGCVFWPDFPQWNLKADQYHAFGLEHPSEFKPMVKPQWQYYGRPIQKTDNPSFESGQFMIDKARHWKPLRLSLWWNEHSDYSYRWLHGDKDTFLMAWRQRKAPFSMPRVWPDWDTHTAIQHDFDGNRLFPPPDGRGANQQAQGGRGEPGEGRGPRTGGLALRMAERPGRTVERPVMVAGNGRAGPRGLRLQAGRY